VDVADIQHSKRVVPRRETLLANVQGSTQSDFKRSAGPQHLTVTQRAAEVLTGS
jgi:hypothetical protein